MFLLADSYRNFVSNVGRAYCHKDFSRHLKCVISVRNCRWRRFLISLHLLNNELLDVRNTVITKVRLHQSQLTVLSVD